MSKTFLTNTKIKDNEKKQKILKIINNESFIGYFKGLSLKPKSYITKEKIELWYKKENQTPLFGSSYPLINLVSKSSVLNKSAVLLPDILLDNTNKILKCDDKMIKSFRNNVTDFDLSTMYQTVTSFNKRNIKRISIKNLSNPFPNNYKNNYAKNVIIRKYLKSHDSNYFNRNYFIVNPLNSYEENSYKLKKLFQKSEFINKIKSDVSSLKFNSSLIANTDYF